MVGYFLNRPSEIRVRETCIQAGLISFGCIVYDTIYLSDVCRARRVLCIGRKLAGRDEFELSSSSGLNGHGICSSSGARGGAQNIILTSASDDRVGHLDQPRAQSRAHRTKYAGWTYSAAQRRHAQPASGVRHTHEASVRLPRVARAKAPRCRKARTPRARA